MINLYLNTSILNRNKTQLIGYDIEWELPLGACLSFDLQSSLGTTDKVVLASASPSEFLVTTLIRPGFYNHLIFQESNENKCNQIQ
jgi:hypothetical protein